MHIEVGKLVLHLIFFIYRSKILWMCVEILYRESSNIVVGKVVLNLIFFIYETNILWMCVEILYRESSELQAVL